MPTCRTTKEYPSPVAKNAVAVCYYGTRIKPASSYNLQVGRHKIPLPRLGHGAARDGANMMSCSRKWKMFRQGPVITASCLEDPKHQGEKKRRKERKKERRKEGKKQNGRNLSIPTQQSIVISE